MTTFVTSLASAPSTESTLSVTRTQLMQALGRYLSWSRSPSDWTAEQTDDAAAIIRSAERMFYHPERLPGEHTVHVWSFLDQRLELDINASYSTGTVAISSGTVTLTGGTWPSWAASGWLEVDGAEYEVSSRTSGSVIVLADSITVASGASYTLSQWEYALPSLFGGNFLESYLAFHRLDENWVRVRLTGPNEIHGRRQTDWVTGVDFDQPFLAAVERKTRSQTTGQRFQLIIWPSVTSAGTIIATYTANPSAITDSEPYPLGGEQHAETLLAAVLAAAELYMNDERSVHRDTFKERLWASVALDRKLNTPKYFGMNLDRPQTDLPRHRGQVVTINGVLYDG